MRSIVGQAYFIALWPAGGTLRELIRVFASMLFYTAHDFKDIFANCSVSVCKLSNGRQVHIIALHVLKLFFPFQQAWQRVS